MNRLSSDNEINIKYLVCLNDYDGLTLTNGFYRVLNKFFISRNPKEQLLEDVKNIKKHLSKLKDFETYLLRLKETIKEDIVKRGEYYKKEIENKGLERLKELSEPINEKNRVVLDILTNLYKKIHNAISDNKGKEEFINRFREAILYIDLSKETKRNLLEWINSVQFWGVNDKPYFCYNNTKIENALRKLISEVGNGGEPNKILIELDKNNNVICKELEAQNNIKKNSDKENTIKSKYQSEVKNGLA